MNSAFENPQKTVTCHECALPVTLPSLEHKERALCPRCGFQLTQFYENRWDRVLAFSITALIFLLLSLPYPFLSFSASGHLNQITIIEGIEILFDKGHWLLAIIQFMAIIALPCIILMSLAYLTVLLKTGVKIRGKKQLVSLVYWLIPWSMAEVFLVGVMVSLIKLNDLADVSLGLSFYAYTAFIVCFTITLLYLDRYHLEKHLDITPPRHTPVTDHGLRIQQTWALLLTSVILYIPANVLPIMHTRLLGQEEPSTILGGVILLWQSGSYPVATVIFVASVMVPVAKLLILSWLNYSIQKGFQGKNSERIFWYRVTEFIGRWSMIDVFVVAILVSLIQLGNTMRILPGSAALAFCGVVILTMLAAMTFDTRLIWHDSRNTK